jgi:hypothetical protein
MPTDLPAGTYPLDPREAGKATVEILETRYAKGGAVFSGWLWRTAYSGGFSCCQRMNDAYYSTGAEALHAARVAAGLGDVAEEACATYVGTRTRHENAAGVVIGTSDSECSTCRWPRARHGEKTAQQ